jgi:hypothetical protein
MLLRRSARTVGRMERTSTPGPPTISACSTCIASIAATIASAAHTLAGDDARAAFWAANVHERNDNLTREDFFRAFPMKSDPLRARVDQALGRVGFR